MKQEPEAVLRHRSRDPRHRTPVAGEGFPESSESEDGVQSGSDCRGEESPTPVHSEPLHHKTSCVSSAIDEGEEEKGWMQESEWVDGRSRATEGCLPTTRKTQDPG